MTTPRASDSATTPLDLALPAEVAAALGTTIDGLAQMRYRRTGPPFVRIGPRRADDRHGGEAHQRRVPNPDYPGRDAAGRFMPGNTGSADGAAAAELRLRQYEAENGTKVIRQQIRVAIVDPATGQPMTDPQIGKPLFRFYDALEPTGTPGQYVGIEVKSGDASLTRPQRVFDSRVTAQSPAVGTLNGQPVKIVDTELLNTPRFVPGEALPRTSAEVIPRSVVEPVPEVAAPRAAPRLGGIMPDDATPHFVDIPGHLAGAPDVPVLGDGLPDYDR